MPASLPTFSRGLKLVRIGVFVMLLQLVVTVVVTVKTLSADSADESRDAVKWMEYLLLANIGATFAMLVGVARAIPELARARMGTGGLVIAAAGFAIATAALAWTYHLLSEFISVAFDPNSSLDDVVASAEGLESTKYLAIIKDLSYAIGLTSVLRTVQRSAAFNDQLGLRDEAGSMSRALIVMLVADLFYQLTYGLGGTTGILGVVGSLLVAGYWIYCHLRLARFLYNAAYFMNEPHDLPLATVVRAGETPRPSQPRVPRSEQASAQRESRPSLPEARPSSPPAPIVVVQPRAPAPAPRAASSAEDPNDVEEPRFLK